MRRALLVGIDRYRTAPQLYCCVSDAEALETVLAQNHDLSPNYRCEVLTNEKGQAVEAARSEEHTSELQSLMRISYAVFCLKKKTNQQKKSIKLVIKHRPPI